MLLTAIPVFISLQVQLIENGRETGFSGFALGSL
jgi:hypothetical protein